MTVPFYAETAPFQLWTAMAYLAAAGLLMSVEKRNWEYFAAGVVCLYIAFDEYFMIHECIRLTFPLTKKLVRGDLTVFILSLTGVCSAIWGMFKLSRKPGERLLFAFSILICALEIYLDVFEKHIFYLELDVKIEEVAEMLQAIVLIGISLMAGIRKRVFIILPLFFLMFFLIQNTLHSFIFTSCPKLRNFR